MDYFSKTDAFVLFYIRDLKTQNWILQGKTETINDNLNPNFKKTFNVDYIFEIKQEVKFEVMDDDGNNSHEFVGECYTTIGAIVGAKNNVFISEIKSKNGHSSGTIVILSESIEECRDHLFMQWKGVKLANTDGWFDKSDPFLRFKKVREDKLEVLVHETEVIMDNLNPIWKPFEISGQKLYNGDPHRPIKLECWDWEQSQNFQFIGETMITGNDLISGKKEFEIQDKKKKKRGTLVLMNFSIRQKPTFLDYIRGNTQLNIILAVDFTGSNGVVTSPSSQKIIFLYQINYYYQQRLHYISPNGLNQYQQAIISVGEILLDYDFDKKVPCFGFGGVPRYPTMHVGGVSHCFPMSGNPADAEAFGLNEIMNLYKYSLQNVSLSGPTLFGPIISETLKVSNVCKSQGSQVYTVLLIVTDGEIHDMQETINMLVMGSDQPLSVIIVGVGNADFTNMEQLDGDGGMLVNNQGRRASRDIVQFVPFRKYQGNSVLLAKEVLAEIPDQLVQYMVSQGIQPQPPQQINMTQFQMQNTQISNNVKQFGMNLLNQGGFLDNVQAPPPSNAGQGQPQQFNQPPPQQFNQPPPQQFNQPPPQQFNQVPPPQQFNQGSPQQINQSVQIPQQAKQIGMNGMNYSQFGNPNGQQFMQQQPNQQIYQGQQQMFTSSYQVQQNQQQQQQFMYQSHQVQQNQFQPQNQGPQQYNNNFGQQQQNFKPN